MSKVIAGFSMSLDGFIADPDHGTDHVFRWYSAGGTDAEIMTSGTDSVMTREASEFIEEAGRAAGVLVTGRRTFDVAYAWGGKHPMDVPMVLVTHTVPEEWANREGSPFTYVTGGVPQADGSQKAVEVHIFPKPQEDGGHFYDGWYGAPNGTMTNGFVQPLPVTTAATGGGTGGGDPSIVVKYPQGEKRISIPADAHIVRNVPGSRDDLKAGAAFRAQTATKQPDGTYTASAINVGREGARPF